VWIEITPIRIKAESYNVTPHAGVWIEMGEVPHGEADPGSHPTRVCGLKFDAVIPGPARTTSHPTRVCGLKSWLDDMTKDETSHTPRGCVD